MESFTLQMSETCSVTFPDVLCDLLNLRPGDQLKIEVGEHRILSVALYRSDIFSDEIRPTLNERTQGIKDHFEDVTDVGKRAEEEMRRQFEESVQPEQRAKAAS